MEGRIQNEAAAKSANVPPKKIRKLVGWCSSKLENRNGNFWLLAQIELFRFVQDSGIVNLEKKNDSTRNGFLSVFYLFPGFNKSKSKNFRFCSLCVLILVKRERLGEQKATS